MGHSHSRCHRTMKIKTFRPEICSVDIMMGKVSSCLLPGGGAGDDECDVMEQITRVLTVSTGTCALLQPASLIILIFASSQAASVITETEKQICPFTLPSRPGDNGPAHNSLVHSHWSRNVEAWLSLVESVAGAISLMP